MSLMYRQQLVRGTRIFAMPKPCQTLYNTTARTPTFHLLGGDRLKKNLSQESEYRRMTETSVPKLVMTLSLPTVLSQMITSIYNMADTYFVTRLGDSAVGAVSIVYALQSIIQAVGFGLAMGAGSLVSVISDKRIEMVPVNTPPVHSFRPFFLAFC